MEFKTSALTIVETDKISREEWLEYRKLGIGGSDCATVFGLSPFSTARGLYYDKIGEKPATPENDNWIAKEYGNRLESFVGEIFGMVTELEVFPVHKMFRHPVYQFMLADVDFFIVLPNGKIGILETKTTGQHSRDKWENDAIPYNYELQVRHYMAVLDIDFAYIACLMGNSENDFLYRPIERDLDFEQDIIAQEQYFWEEHVLKRIPPPYTESGDLVLESIRRHYGNNSSSALTKLNTKHAKAIEEYLALHEEKLKTDRQSKELDDKLKKLYAPILDDMKNAVSAVCLAGNKEYTISNKPSFRTGISKEDLEKLKVHHPDVYSKFVDQKESRRFSIKAKEIYEWPILREFIFVPR